MLVAKSQVCQILIKIVTKQIFRSRGTHAGKATAKDGKAGTTLAAAATSTAITTATRAASGKSSCESGRKGEEKDLKLHIMKRSMKTQEWGERDGYQRQRVFTLTV